MAETLLIGLASWRVFRLIGRDTITEPLRRPLSGWLAEMVECGFCLGTWAALGMTFLVDQVHPLPVPWLVAAGAAAVVGLVEIIAARLSE